MSLLSRSLNQPANRLGEILETVKSRNEEQRVQLIGLGKYISECLPKYVQKSLITANNELEILIHPEGVLAVLNFLKENHRTQFHSFINVTAIDVLTRPYRFEVSVKDRT